MGVKTLTVCDGCEKELKNKKCNCETKVDLRFWNDDDGYMLRTKEGVRL